MREKKEINIQIGEQIRLAREQAELTQEQFAERIEVSPQYISDLERGVVGISSVYDSLHSLQVKVLIPTAVQDASLVTSSSY